VRVSDKPADADHSTGTQVREFSALSRPASAVDLRLDRLRASALFFHSVEIEPGACVLVMLLSIAVDACVRVLSDASRRIRQSGSGSRRAAFFHDIWSSAVVIVGLALFQLAAAISSVAAPG